MPKELKKYRDFSGGLNTGADPRHIMDNELSDIDDMIVDSQEGIRTMGGLETCPQSPATSGAIPTVAIKSTSGYGLFSFGADVDMPTGTPTYGRNNFIAAAHCPASGNQDVYIYGDHTQGSGTTKSWMDEVTVGTTPGSKMVFYYAENALRICDANFGANNSFKWFGYVKNTHWDGVTNREQNWDGWYSVTNALTAPTEGIASKGTDGSGEAGSNGTTIVNSDLQDYTSTLGATDNYIAVAAGVLKARDITAQGGSPYNLTTDDLAGGDTWLTEFYDIYPPAGTGFVIHVEPQGSGGSWTAQTLEFASTFIYIGGQESLLFKMSGTVAVVDDDELDVHVFATQSYDRRITGGRIYYRKSGSSDPWKLFVDISMMDGSRVSLSTSWTAWSNAGNYTGSGHAGSNIYIYVYLNNELSSKEQNSDTYESLTGLPQDTWTLTLKAKCFATGNNRTWAGSIKTTDSANNTIYYGDRVAYTPPNKYDTFPPDYYLDIATGDGDEVKALAVYADRLLVFKENKLFLVNISKGADTGFFMESQHEFLGVKFPGAVFKCDVGVLWVNENGCYLYNGERIINLLEKSQEGILRRIISDSSWRTFITDTSTIGYDPKRRRIIVVGDASSITGSIYMYDLPIGAWTKGTRFSKASGVFTNFATYENDLIVGDYTT